jgi:3-methylcrotonyl-CoA carboxylase alpha subunit
VEGVRTNARFLWEILGAEPVRAGDVSTRLLEQALQPVVGVPDAEATDAWLIAAAVSVQRMPGSAGGAAHAAACPWESATGFRLNSPATIRVPLRLGETAHWIDLHREKWGHACFSGVRKTGMSPFSGVGSLLIELAGKRHRVEILTTEDGHATGLIDGRSVEARVEADHDQITVRRQCLRFDFRDDTGAEHRASAEHEGHFRAPMPGHVLDLRVTEGQEVAEGAVLVVLEAMKMEHSLYAPWDGRVKAVHVKAGDRVEEGADLVLLEPRTEA